MTRKVILALGGYWPLATPTIQSGWAFEYAGQPHGTFGIIACSPAPRRGITRFFQSPDLPFTTPELWILTERIRSSAFTGPFYGAAAIVAEVEHAPSTTSSLSVPAEVDNISNAAKDLPPPAPTAKSGNGKS